jgi:hypothetical protein
MTSTQQLQSFSSMADDELLHNLSEILQQSRRVDAELVAHIGEVDDRRLYAREACSSMFAFCVGVASRRPSRTSYRRRAPRKHPCSSMPGMAGYT